MARLFNISFDRLGRSPGTVEFHGKPKTEQVHVRCLAIGPERVVERDPEDILAGGRPARGEVLWVDVIGLHDVALIRRLGERFDLDALVLEDVVATTQRTKIDEREDFLFLVSRWSTFEAADARVRTEQIGIVLGGDFVVSFQEREPDAFAPVRERLENPGARLRTGGAAYLANALLDAVADDQMRTTALVGERIERLEEEMLEAIARGQAAELHARKRNLMVLRRVVRPLRDLTRTLQQHESALLAEDVRGYLDDVHDHACMASDAIDTYEALLGNLDAYYESRMNQRLNETMKVLTIIATIFVPLTFVAGIYGMNFEHMPELRWRWAYPAAWGVMVAMAVVMIAYFRRRKWF